MLVTQVPNPEEEKDPQKRKNYILRVWFYIMFITPLIILYYKADTPIMSEIMGVWTVIVGVPILLSGIIELVINLGSKKRPLLSFSNRFIIIATCWIALFLTGYIYNVSQESTKDTLANNSIYASSEQSELESLLIEVSLEINKQCPAKLNEMLQFDSISIIEGSVFQYNFSFFLSEEEIIELYKSLGYENNEERQFFQEQLIQMYKTQPSLDALRELKVTLRANYRDIDGKTAYTLSATPGVDF